MFTPAEHFFTPEQLATAERLAGDLTLAPYPMPNPLAPKPASRPEALRKRHLKNVERTALDHARAIDNGRPQHLIDAYWKAHLFAIDTYQRLYGRKPERIGGVWM